MTASHAILNGGASGLTLEHVSGRAMPFSKHDIDPEHIEAMRAAFHRVCDALQLNCHADDPMTEIVVMKIVELAKAGERDPEVLCIDVLAQLEMPPQSEASDPFEQAPPPMTSAAAK